MPGAERGGEVSKGNSLSELKREADWSGGVRNGSTEEDEGVRECGMVGVEGGLEFLFCCGSE